MFLLRLLTCLMLSTFCSFRAQAKVVDSYSECSQFFYEGREPKGMDQNAEKICQKMEGNTFLFATLYSVYNKIPLYSAYKYVPKCSSSSANKWHLEPQLYSRDQPDHMMLEKDCDVSTLKDSQAVSGDYAHTGYDRGHLYPNRFQCGDMSIATFTLTNAAPMDARFSRIQWRIWEGYLRCFLKTLYAIDNTATTYIITGTVPGKERIPQKETCEDTQNIKRVTVPSHIWTVVCYKHNNDKKSFSFGYIGQNQAEFNTQLMSVSDINLQLNQLYRKSAPKHTILRGFLWNMAASEETPNIQIFHDDCFSNTTASQVAKTQFSKLIKLPEHQRHWVTEGAESNLFALQNVISSESDKTKITGLTGNLTYDSSISFLTSLETLKKLSKSACLLIAPKKRKLPVNHNIRKKEVSDGSEFFECQLVPEKSVEKTAADGSPCTSVVDDGNKCACFTPEGESKPCCSTPCLYQNKIKGYRCYSGWRQIECSPQYSLIAIGGKRCRDDHPCATYGKDYYWCYTDDDSWAYCSPPLWGSRAKDGKFCRSDYACAKYKKISPWCYTDVNNWNYCCTSDDCFSAVEYKTCKPDHPCSYHGKNYLWCYTTDGSWNYCCRPCS